MVHRQELPARVAKYDDASDTLPPLVRSTLAGVGINRLYAHQGKALHATTVLKKHVVITTSTCSGKSLCYHIPVLTRLVETMGNSSAIYIYPTKALAQDQLRSLHELCRSCEAAAACANGADDALSLQRAVGVFDGDTPWAARKQLQEIGRVFLTNPDTLHATLLPNHRMYADLFSRLELIVVDEAHAYRGAFGSHVALVLRRLLRIMSRCYGRKAPDDVRIVVSSATMRDAVPFAAGLLGVHPSRHDDFVHVCDDDSPNASKTFLLWNPPFKAGASEERRGKRRQRILEAEAIRAPPPETEGNVALASATASDNTTAVTNLSARPSTQALAQLAQLERERQRRERRRANDRVAARVRDWEAARRARGVAAAAAAATAAAAAVANHDVDDGGGDNDDDDDDDIGKEAATGAEYGGTFGERRVSPIAEMGKLLAECVQHRLRCLAFCRTRKLSELVCSYARDFLQLCDEPELARSVAAYRAGYTASERRSLEGSLFSGELLGVAATNALELGIDVGTLDVTLHLGFPGSAASLWQQSGRAGRLRGGEMGDRHALSIYVAFEGPLDQYFMRMPSRLFDSAMERACVDPENFAVMLQHLPHAAHEATLVVDVGHGNEIGDDGSADDARWFGPRICGAVDVCRAAGWLTTAPPPDHRGGLCYSGPRKGGAGGLPDLPVNLRAIEDEPTIQIIRSDTGELLEELEKSKAVYALYEGAVILHQGRSYIADSVPVDLGAAAMGSASRGLSHMFHKPGDLAYEKSHASASSGLVARVRPADILYYTAAVEHKDLEVVGGNPLCRGTYLEDDEVTRGSGGALYGPCIYRQVLSGYRKVWKRSGETFDVVELPEAKAPVEFETVATWVRVPDTARALCEARTPALEFRAGLHAANHALLAALPLYIMAASGDVAAECVNKLETRYKPSRLLLYDKHPGGVGVCAQIRPIFREVMQAALELVRACTCDHPSGCPTCCQFSECNQYNEVLDKDAALIVLTETLASM